MTDRFLVYAVCYIERVSWLVIERYAYKPSVGTQGLGLIEGCVAIS